MYHQSKISMKMEVVSACAMGHDAAVRYEETERQAWCGVQATRHECQRGREMGRDHGKKGKDINRNAHLWNMDILPTKPSQSIISDSPELPTKGRQLVYTSPTHVNDTELDIRGAHSPSAIYPSIHYPSLIANIDPPSNTSQKDRNRHRDPSGPRAPAPAWGPPRRRTPWGPCSRRYGFLRPRGYARRRAR